MPGIQSRPEEFTFCYHHSFSSSQCHVTVFWLLYFWLRILSWVLVYSVDCPSECQQYFSSHFLSCVWVVFNLSLKILSNIHEIVFLGMCWYFWQFWGNFQAFRFPNCSDTLFPVSSLWIFFYIYDIILPPWFCYPFS